MSMDTAISIVNLFVENLPAALWLILFIYVGMRAGIIPSSRDMDEINENISKNIDEVNKNASGNVAEINERINKIDEEINEKINKINETLARQTTAVNILMTKEKLGTMISESPLTLSEKGEKISKSIDAEKIVNSRLGELRAEFEALSNSYDIQEKAMELGESIYDDLPENVKNSAKEEIYQNGLQLFQIYPIFSLILRDAILKERETNERGMEKIPAAQPSP